MGLIRSHLLEVSGENCSKDSSSIIKKDIKASSLLADHHLVENPLVMEGVVNLSCD